MSAFLKICQESPLISKQLAELDAQLDSVVKPVQDALDALHTPEAQKIADSVQDAIRAHDTVFQNGDVSSYEDARKNAGLQPDTRTERDAQKYLVSQGFCPVAGKIYACNNKVLSAPSTSAIGDGDLDIAGLKVLIAGYADPSTDSYTSPTYATDVGVGRSATGTYNNTSGTVDALRELCKAFGGDIVALRAFLVAIQPVGYGVVWSMSIATQVYPADGVTFDVEYVRSTLSYPIYDFDVSIVQNVATVTGEIFVAHDVARAQALRVRDALCTKLGLNTAPLLCRPVRLRTSEDVRAQAVCLATKGCDPTRLGTSCYQLGITVNGWSRVIDVTGDSGSRFFVDEYTASSVASKISRVFDPILVCEARAGEIVMQTRDRGPDASISFFYCGNNDASTVLGIEAMLASSLGLDSTGKVYSLKSSASASYIGGATVSEDIPTGFVSAMSKYGVNKDMLNAALSGDSYWSLYQDTAAAYVDKLQSLVSDYTSKDSIRDRIDAIKSSVTSYVEYTGFTDIVSLSYRDAILVMDELGDTAFSTLMLLHPEVFEINLYVSNAQVTSALNDFLQNKIDGGGVIKADTSMTIAGLFRQNKGKSSYLAGLYLNLQNNVNVLSTEEQELLWTLICSYVSSLYWATLEIVEKDSPDASLSGTDSGDNDLTWSDVVNFAENLVTDPGKLLSEGMSALVDYACSLDAATCRKLKNLMSDASGAVDTAEEKIASFFDWLASPAGAAIRALATAMALINRLLDRAIALVTSVKSGITGKLQGALSTKKSLPEVLNSLANLTTSVYSNFGFNSKFLSCYVSGSASAALSVVFANLLAIVNAYISAINALIDAVLKAANSALALFQCLADKITASFTGSVTYEASGSGTYSAAGLVSVPVSYKLTCTSTFGASAMDPRLSRELANMQAKLTELMNLLKLSTITINNQSDTVKLYKKNSAQANAAGLIVDALKQALLDKLAALLSC